MILYYAGLPDLVEDGPETLLKKANIMLSFNDIKIRRHSKRFRRILKERKHHLLLLKQRSSMGKS